MQKCIYCNTEIESGLETCPSCGMSLIETHTLKPGTVIGGKYEVISKLGEGGFGITYIVRNTIFDENQAMKELFIKSTCGRANTSHTNTNHVYSSQNQDFDYYKQKFIGEMRTLLKINHENIVRMFDLVIENNTVYGIMEYINGSTLKKKIREEGKLNESEAMDLLIKVGGGLKKIHDLGLTHRDIKPDNIMIDSEGNYKIIDFGLVKEYQEASVTLSQVVSEGYSPKEQYRKKGKVTPATDIYSLGMTVYAALTGNLSPENPTDRSDKEVENDFQLELISLNVSDKLKAVLRKMTEIEKSDRYQDFEEIFKYLDNKENLLEKVVEHPVVDTIKNNDVVTFTQKSSEDITEDKPDQKKYTDTSFSGKSSKQGKVNKYEDTYEDTGSNENDVYKIERNERKSNTGKIIGITFVILIVLISILAAIALPAYNGYIKASKERVAINAAATYAQVAATFYSQYQIKPSKEYLNEQVGSPEGYSYDILGDRIIVFGDGSKGYEKDEDFETQEVYWR